LAAFLTRNYPLARADYKAVLKEDPTNKYRLDKIAWYDLGVLDQKLGDRSAARSEYAQALKLDPKYVDALYNMGVLETSTDVSVAINLYRRALALAPKSPDIRWNLGLLLYDTGHVAQGRVLLKSAIELSPSIAARLPKNVTL
jgi:tetratricopeptide (TPR) repeat protein